MIMISNSIEGESLTLKYQPSSVFNEDNLQEAEIEKSTVLVSFSNINKKTWKINGILLPPQPLQTW